MHKKAYTIFQYPVKIPRGTTSNWSLAALSPDSQERKSKTVNIYVAHYRQHITNAKAV
jgi:hypothetical protein